MVHTLIDFLTFAFLLKGTTMVDASEEMNWASQPRHLLRIAPRLVMKSFHVFHLSMSEARQLVISLQVVIIIR